MARDRDERESLRRSDGFADLAVLHLERAFRHALRHAQAGNRLIAREEARLADDQASRLGPGVEVRGLLQLTRHAVSRALRFGLRAILLQLILDLGFDFFERTLRGRFLFDDLDDV